MELFQAIHSRRTVKDFKSDPVPDELLLRALEAGLWAQNHRMTQPWRFYVVGPQTRAALTPLFPKAPTKPAIVAVSCLKSDDAVQEREDYAAVACAIQNIQLAAWDLGLGMQWSSGRAATGPDNYVVLGIDPNRETLVGLLLFGFPETVPAAQPRRPLDEVLRRLD